MPFVSLCFKSEASLLKITLFGAPFSTEEKAKNTIILDMEQIDTHSCCITHNKEFLLCLLIPTAMKTERINGSWIHLDVV